MDGCDFIVSNNTTFLKCDGHYFSWHNGTSVSRIDHYFVNGQRIMEFPGLKLVI